MNRNLTFYFLILILFGSLSWLVIHEGERQNQDASTIKSDTLATTHKSTLVQNTISKEKENNSILNNALDTFKDQIASPLGILLVQIIIIVILSRFLGIIFSKFGQPIVIGEIIAGILLGPSLLGSFFPEIYNFIFPVTSLKNLQLLSQFGLILFMFVIGMEIDTKMVRKRINSAIMISFTGIIFPYFLGILLSFFIYSSFAMPNVSFTTFSLFIGIAMSITAFPVLARIIHEKGLTKTPLGVMAISCAATDDITAWLIFAAIIAIVQAGTAMNALLIIIIAISFIFVMLFFAQPILKRIGNIYVSGETLSKTVIAFIFLLLFISAFFTEAIGIHALFGAFIAGVIVPKNQFFKKLMINKIEDISTVVLLPLFFAFSGLRTEIGLLNTSYLWIVCFVVIIIAIIGKLGGVSIAAHFTGFSWRDSISIGVLMNTRGLMELIVLNIGYDLGILSPEIFSIMVIMALTTTFMAGPSLNFIGKYKKDAHIIQDKHEHMVIRTLISFGIPQMGSSLLKIAHSLTAKDNHSKNKNIIALHLTPHTEITSSEAHYFERKSFIPINNTATGLGINIKTVYKTSDDVTKDILLTAKKERASLLLMGAAKSVFNKNVLGGRVKNIIDQVKCNVGVFIDKDFQELKNVLILTDNIYYEKFLNISERLLINSECTITFVLSEGATVRELPDILKNDRRIEFTGNLNVHASTLKQYDVLITNLDYFERKLRESSTLLEATPSLLLLNFKDNKIFSL